MPAASNGECERAGFSVPDVIYSNVNTSAHSKSCVLDSLTQKSFMYISAIKFALSNLLELV